MAGRRHSLQKTIEMVKNTRISADLDSVYDLMLTLIQYGADANIVIKGSDKKPLTNFLSYYVQLISHKVNPTRDKILK